MSNMWDAATSDPEQEKMDEVTAAAHVAVASHQGFVLQASTKLEFDDRLAIVQDKVASAIERVTYSDPSMFPMVHASVLASWERDFDIVSEAKADEVQKRNARRAYERSQARRTANYLTDAYDEGRAAGEAAYLAGQKRLLVDRPESRGDGGTYVEYGKGWYAGWDRLNVQDLTNEAIGLPVSRQSSMNRQAASTSDMKNMFAGVPSNTGSRDMDPQTLLAQIGRMNVLAISGGRASVILGDNRKPIGVYLPVSNGYGVNVFLTDNDTYTVQRVFRGAVKGEQGNVYSDEVGEAAYQASSFRSNDFGGHRVGSKTAAAWKHMDNYGWYLNPVDFGYGYWAKIEEGPEGFTLLVIQASGDDFKGDEIIDESVFSTLEEAQAAADRHPKKTAKTHSDSTRQHKRGGWQTVNENTGDTTEAIFKTKEVAEQQDHGDGFSVQYVPDEKTSSRHMASVTWDQSTVPMSLYNGLTEMVTIWTAESMGVTGDIVNHRGGYNWFVHSADNEEGDPLDEGVEVSLEAAKGMSERAMIANSTQMSLFAASKKTAKDDPCWEDYEMVGMKDKDGKSVPNCVPSKESSSRIAGENPFAKKDDDEKKAAPKKDGDTSDSDKDGEQDGPLQDGEKAEKAAPAAPAAAAPATEAAPTTDAPIPDQNPAADPAAGAVPADPNAAAAPAAPAEDPVPTDPTTMDVGHSSQMSFTMADGGAGQLEVTFVREENGVYYFNGPTGEFGVGQQQGKWQDADGNVFQFGVPKAQDTGIAPAQNDAVATDANAVDPNAAPDPNAAATPQAAQPAAAPPVEAPAKEAPPADAPKDDAPAEPKKDDEEAKKKENPFAKKSGSN